MFGDTNNSTIHSKTKTAGKKAAGVEHGLMSDQEDSQGAGNFRKHDVVLKGIF